MRLRAWILAVSLALPATALAQDAEPPPPPPAPTAPYAPPPAAGGLQFGRQGQMVFAIDLPLANTGPQFGIIHQTQSMGGPSTTLYRIAPSADFFVIPNLSLGALLDFERQSQDVAGMNVSVTIFGIAARLGYDIPISDLVSLWPRVEIGYSHGSTDILGNSATLTSIPFVLDIPLLFHPAPHFFIGPGFVFATQLTSSASSGGVSADQPKLTQIGVDLTIGGYFGGT
jgi:hypothetical protein